MKRAGLRLSIVLTGVLGFFAHQGCGEIRLTGSGVGKVGTFFFFWHDCLKNLKPTRVYPYPFGPDNACTENTIPYHPPAMGGFTPFPYSARSVDWYADELQKMKRAGIDYVFPVYWGDHPIITFFNTADLGLLVQAVDRIGSDLKLGLFDDTSSEVAKWNFDNGRDYTTKPAMNLADKTLWPYFYEGKIQPYFRAIPRRLWATHNGQPLERGGRPIIITWVAKADEQNPKGPSFFEYHAAAASLWHNIKQRFQTDFGVEPFIVFETSWYNEAKDLDVVGDAQYSWGAAAFHSIWHVRKGYVISSVGPGYDDHLVRPDTARVRRRNVTHGEDGVETSGDSVAFLRNEYLLDHSIPNWPNHGVRKDSDLVLIETWNELYEGTAVEPALDFPDLQHPGQLLPPDTYIETLRELKKDRPGYRDYDHTLVASRSNPDGTWTLTVRNDGALAWKKGQAQLGWRIHAQDGKRLAEGTVAEVPQDVPFGGTVDLTFRQPAEWTDTGRFPSAAVIVDMKIDGAWATDLGDGFFTRPILPQFPGFF
jgi:uncharacterized protein DUF5010